MADVTTPNAAQDAAVKVQQAYVDNGVGAASDAFREDLRASLSDPKRAITVEEEFSKLQKDDASTHTLTRMALAWARPQTSDLSLNPFSKNFLDPDTIDRKKLQGFIDSKDTSVEGQFNKRMATVLATQYDSMTSGFRHTMDGPVMKLGDVSRVDIDRTAAPLDEQQPKMKLAQDAKNKLLGNGQALFNQVDQEGSADQSITKPELEKAAKDDNVPAEGRALSKTLADKWNDPSVEQLKDHGAITPAGIKRAATETGVDGLVPPAQPAPAPDQSRELGQIIGAVTADPPADLPSPAPQAPVEPGKQPTEQPPGDKPSQQPASPSSDAEKSKPNPYGDLVRGDLGQVPTATNPELQAQLEKKAAELRAQMTDDPSKGGPTSRSLAPVEPPSDNSPKDTAPPASPKDTAPPVSPKDTAPPESPKDTAPPASPKDTAPPESPKDTPPPESPKDTPPPASPKDTAPPASPKDTTPPASPKDTAPPESPKDTAPPESPKDTAPPESPKDTAPPESPKDTAPPASPKDTAPPTSPKDTVPPVSPKDTAPPASPKDTAPPASPKDTAPPASPKDTAPPASPKDTVPPVPPKTVPDKTPLASATVRDGEGYWDLAAKMLRMTDDGMPLAARRHYINTHLTGGDRAQIYLLMEKMRKANHDNVRSAKLHPGMVVKNPG